MERMHYFGCAPYERELTPFNISGKDKGSHLTCNQGRSHHQKPFSIACCYEGGFCNINLTVPPFVNFDEDILIDSDPMAHRYPDILFYSVGAIIFGLIIMISSVIFIRRCYAKKKRKMCESKMSLSSIGSDSIIIENEELLPVRCAPLNQRTAAQYLTFISEVARGRYGCVNKAWFRTREVAVKTFYTNEEESWRNEKSIYETQMLNHENILQFVAADICSVDSITQMLLITDFHPLGSLYDYLRVREDLDLNEAIHIAHTTVCGLEHLHTKMQGTGNRLKPEIAHRDIKSKNIIVKRKNVCCIADFGLAVRLEGGQLIPARINPQSGTRRYMSPEVLSGRLNINNFDEFIKSDIYSLALVFWEIFSRVNLNKHSRHRRVSSDSSATSGESATLLSTEKSEIKPFRLSYDEYVTNDPSIEQMKTIVCVRKLRPTIPASWSADEKHPLAAITKLIEEMWVDSYKSRHRALKIKVELDRIIAQLAPVRGNSRPAANIISPSSTTSGYASGSRQMH